MTKDLTRNFRDKLFYELLEELKTYNPDDDEFFEEWYEELNGSGAIILLLVRELYNYNDDLGKLKDRIEQLINMTK